MTALIVCIDALSLFNSLTVQFSSQFGFNDGLLRVRDFVTANAQAGHGAVRLDNFGQNLQIILTDNNRLNPRLAVSCRVLRRAWIGRFRADLVVRNRRLGVEKLVLEYLGRLRSLLGIVGEHPFHETNGFW